MAQYRVGILLFDDVEVLDYCGPFEVFSTTRMQEPRERHHPPPFEVVLLAETAATVTTSGGMQVLPHATLYDAPALDILIIPGGWGTRQQANNTALLNWLVQQHAQVNTLASVCTGSMLLAQAGLLNGLQATTHWRSLSRMREQFPKVKVIADKHFVMQGNICTSAGISAGIDLSIRLVARYLGETVARNTAKHMEYPYPESDTRRIQGIE
ncbi:DJ-1/PfpI family protein [Lacimicrobium sp. SS2-24]|uniref:DJ-1/PfpI family protein n=1 Tax=Lacimicrobium sp. SS2-24 TaxID=2005569 RepID=UPI000B4BA142|nr:DJ-1/PfpI family protein [Lacimicrobium sp. SS2-24]